MVELLSPAGNFQKLKTAIHFGADAVYCSFEDFGLRSRAGNFTLKELKEAIEYTKKTNRKIYLTLNSYLFDKDFDKLKDFLSFLKNYPPDALIVSDFGVLSFLQETKIPIHISTQANITNSYAANFLKQFNVERIIAARELTLADLGIFVKNASLDVEVFIHGAMCMAYSGRCFISSYLTGRSANKGDCAQSCRWKYTIFEDTRKNIPFFLEVHKEGSFIFNSYDLCALPILDRIIETGVKSLKIEGRNKSEYYAGLTTKSYRKAIDSYYEGTFKKHVLSLYEQLKTVSHRPYSFGFFLGKPKQYLKSSAYLKPCTYVALVLDRIGDKLKLLVKNRFEAGSFEFVTPNDNITVSINEMYTNDLSVKQIAHPGEIVYIKSVDNVNKNDILRFCYESDSWHLQKQAIGI
ncbi:U32 family peptidase [Desulfurella sp.]|uniref:peptidase U32 family protein n=1 Tax=Desulfurella sp. TaxID=1962857 RepID=UPI0025BF0A26|nr:U32 family peptidase [Desulfurella sp.]